MRALLSVVFLSLAMASAAFAEGLKCDMAQYTGSTGLTAGQGGSEVRARYAIENGQPVIRDLAVRKQGGQWATLGQNLAPEYHVVSGMRRMSSDHVASLPAAGI